MKTFVSIDIDYWNWHKWGSTDVKFRAHALKKNLEEVMLTAHNRRIPISAVMNHQQMLPKVNRSGAARIINFDTHSDLADPSITELNCGTWVSYVNWRQQGEYIWIHAGYTSSGECNGSYPIFDNDGITKSLFHRISDWGSYTHNRVDVDSVCKYLNQVGCLQDCIEICVCSSPAYSDDGLVSEFTKWRKKYNIPYQKGIAHEQYGRKVLPPMRKKQLPQELTLSAATG